MLITAEMGEDVVTRFDVLFRTAEMGEDVVMRIRPPRFINPLLVRTLFNFASKFLVNSLS